MRWEEWPRGAEVRQSWVQVQASGRVPAALLWVGPEGVGKTPLAWTLIQALLCSKGERIDPCQHCSSCLAVQKLTHPSLLLFPPTGGNKPLEEAVQKFREALIENPFLSLAEWEERLLGGKGALSIGVEGVRRLADHLLLSRPEGGWQVVWFWHAELLTRQAANALLKGVEEPPPNTLFLFTTNRIEALPPTLRSRCYIWRFPRLSEEELKRLAGQELSIAHLAMAAGSYARLRRVLDAGQSTYIQALREWLRAIFQATPGEDVASAIETLVQAPRLSDLLIMGAQLVRTHPHLSLAQKAHALHELLRMADDLEGNVSPLLVLWEGTLTLREKSAGFNPSWLRS